MPVRDLRVFRQAAFEVSTDEDVEMSCVVWDVVWRSKKVSRVVETFPSSDGEGPRRRIGVESERGELNGIVNVALERRMDAHAVACLIQVIYI